MKKTTPSTLTSLSDFEIESLLDSIRNGNAIQDHTSQTAVTSKIEVVAKKIDEASRQMEEIFDVVAKTGVVPVEEIKNDIMPAIRQAAEIPHIYHLFYELKAKDEYTYRHTVCVGIISTLIGKWLGLSQGELTDLSLGATLHDIGKARVPAEILNKPGRLTNEEYQEMKRHTVYGYRLLLDIPEVSERVALIALQHHEREDGAGYPLSLQSEKIDKLAKIVAIADVYHAMSSSRVYHQAEPFHIVISQMQNDVFGKFDPSIMVVFLYRIMDSLVGRRVLLSNGEEGTILMVDPYEPLRALIKAGDSLIDLRLNRGLRISRVLNDSIVGV
ncbi:HD-GYP domain-containing protein [Mesobacillus subterraneus]|uniref:HD-GYP domain-containing protein n=1 Tax=Mesobacillus subterraneus TaxID=285983 RepID=A0A427TQD8_9BACI|nr:HD-GYP domain-containing protein [Mesobacillus subterraneus]RSD26568.1 HD-GYP domain-containing protein [Mesobacillus subterraneus]